jgi:hypothetical protein
VCTRASAMSVFNLIPLRGSSIVLMHDGQSLRARLEKVKVNREIDHDKFIHVHNENLR